MKRIAKYAAGAALAFLMLVLSVPATAQTDVAGIKVKPAITQQRVDPGKTFSGTLTVTNVSQQQQTYYIQKRNISGLTETGQPQFSEQTGANEYGLASWIQLPVTSVTLQSGASKEVPFTVAVPADAQPGGHFGAIFFTQQPPQNTPNGTGVGFEVASIVSIRISGDADDEAQIREFRTDRSLYGTPEVNFTARIENVGNTLVQPVGFIEISDMFGKKVATLPVNDSGAGVFPKSIRQFTQNWKGEGLVFGNYKARLILSYGDQGKKTLSGETGFWVLPKGIIFTVLGTLLGIFLMLVIGVRLYIRSKIGSAAGSARAQAVSRTMPASPSLLMMAMIAIVIVAVVGALVMLVVSLLA